MRSTPGAKTTIFVAAAGPMAVAVFVTLILSAIAGLLTPDFSTGVLFGAVFGPLAGGVAVLLGAEDVYAARQKERAAPPSDEPVVARIIDTPRPSRARGRS